MVRLGRKKSTLVITLISVVLSVVITTAILVPLDTPFMLLGILIAALVPGIVAPVTAWFMVGMFLKVHALEEQQRRLANYDHLTGLLSRRGFMIESQALFSLCKQSNQKFSVALIELGNLMRINSQYGNRAGDLLLRSLAKTIKRIVRDEDIVGRSGGEQFAVAFADTSTVELKNALNAIDVVTQKATVKYRDQSIGFAVHISSAENSDSTTERFEQILERADAMLSVNNTV